MKRLYFIILTLFSINAFAEQAVYNFITYDVSARGSQVVSKTPLSTQLKVGSCTPHTTARQIGSYGIEIFKQSECEKLNVTLLDPSDISRIRSTNSEKIDALSNNLVEIVNSQIAENAQVEAKRALNSSEIKEMIREIVRQELKKGIE